MDCLNLMTEMPSESVDIILTDPPYLYLTNQKLDRSFDENRFFSEAKRILTEDGFIVLFGRGTSFYRWNTLLSLLDFTFKEEIVWNKSYSSSPLLPISRIHETISISTKNRGIINKTKIPYVEMKAVDIGKIERDINRLNTVFSSEKIFSALTDYFKSGKIHTDGCCIVGPTIASTVSRPNRVVATMSAIENGMNEKSIIHLQRKHYGTIHPTQKPVRLLERLLALVLPKNKMIESVVVFDPFGGSFSTMEAVHNIGCKGISCEIDLEYFNDGKQRIVDIQKI
ncbi:MAG: DNA-methyltransferase [Bacteroidales bacterium]